MPTVSVVIPTYNRANLVGAAIVSVLEQSFQDFEIVVVDDASTDHTEAVVQRFRDVRIKFVRQSANRGDAAARNRGVAGSTGEFVAFLDDDDEWLPEKLRLQLQALADGSSALGGVHTGRYIIDRESGKVTRELAPSGADKEWRISTSSILLKRRCLNEAGPFDEDNPFSSDFDMWLRILSRYQLVYIDQPLVRAYVHGNRLSTNIAKMIKGEEAILRKHGALFVRDSKSYSHHFLNLGVLYCYAGDARKGRQTLARAITIYPFEPRHYFNLALSFLGASMFSRVKRWKERKQ
ncbi:MAG: glycosyltransferase [Acidobacteriota bacterium]|nr:glycosyltransferase [Acidobacteriota bacterium]